MNRRGGKFYVFTLREAYGRKAKRGKMVQRRKGSNRHHPVAWKAGKAN